MPQRKEQENYPEELNEMEGSNLSDIEFRVMIIDTQQYEKRHRNPKKDQSEIKNAIYEINNTMPVKKVG